ncbi:uncharacterized protein BCR38DRAFT_455075 [Pseudomassariella vexata]|uniref:DUF1776-domain-containing protein n=1 Tax=Pseudomassariella vexata TaxID=1141098 RepID=A0A1Y2EFA3_9PEZI|nr:uncharacterized protein BCR38DRAFT_455075 [Pseudomassariella vexata]ORY70250.1 hypothetical protein BCR38DRAFT_455075 [Pseudomassariella vexata]
MSADDQQFLDLLSSLPNQIRRYSTEVADYVDQSVDKVADTLRDSLASAPWLPDWMPEYIKPKAPSRPPPVTIVPMTTCERVQDFVQRHKILTGVMVVAVGYVTYKTVQTRKLSRKTRRAKRARNGGRLEVVVIAGSPTLPLTKSLSLDMERRGFIVYIVCSSIDEELLVQNLSRPDIKPLALDITDPPSAGTSIERFAAYLQAQHAAVPRSKPSYLTLTSVILIPSLNYQTSPIATIPPSSFVDLFNTHLLHPILTIQAFLPLLTSKLTPYGETSTTPKVIVFTPSIISSINPPFHAPEATVCSALSAFTDVLAAELRPLAIPVTHIQLGSFDFAGFMPARTGPHQHQPASLPAETLGWPDAARHTYGRNYMVQSSSAISAGRIRGLRGSSLRHLHNAVFDVIDGSEQNSVIRVGLGAGLYGFVGRYFPKGLVSWMMGIRKVDELSVWSREGSYQESGSEKSFSENGDAGEASEFIAVGKEEDVGANVWKD